jgi:hypothetical protein
LKASRNTAPAHRCAGAVVDQITGISFGSDEPP